MGAPETTKQLPSKDEAQILFFYPCYYTYVIRMFIAFIWKSSTKTQLFIFLENSKTLESSPSIFNIVHWHEIKRSAHSFRHQLILIWETIESDHWISAFTDLVIYFYISSLICDLIWGLRNYSCKIHEEKIRDWGQSTPPSK